MENIFKPIKRNSKRRGFTILELVIVIAVIAILAGVAIPTFAGVVKKARISARTQMAQSINKLLAVDEASNGKPTSMYDATRAMIENGIDIDRFMSDGGLALSWDQEDNRVAVVDEEFNTVYTHDGDALPENKTLIWQVVNEIPDDSATSIYLADGFVGEDIHVSVGVDVGDNLNIKSILYTDEDEESKSILIRANGKETVTDISNSSDEITLLGKADKTSLRNGEINDKNKLSIYESLADFSIYSGNAVIKSGASIEIVRLLSEKQESISLVVENGNMMITGEDFTLVIEEGAHVGSILGADGNLFDFSEDDDNGGNTEGGGDTGGGESTEGGGDTGGGESTEGGETTVPDKPEPEEPDPYYGFVLFDKSKLDMSNGAEVYIVDYESDDESQKYRSLEWAVENAAKRGDSPAYIILLRDLPENESAANHIVTITSNVILDLNGYEISNKGNGLNKIVLEDGAHLRLIDTSDEKTGKVSACFSQTIPKPSAILMNEGTSLTVYDGNISGVAAAIYVEGCATITIKRGTFENVATGATIVLAAKANLYISGGTFIRKDLEKENIFVADPDANGSRVIIDGGTFRNKTATIGTHYTLIDNRTNK